MLARPAHDTEFGHPAPLRRTSQMNHERERGGGLAVHGRTVQTRRHTECLEPGGDLGRPIGVHQRHDLCPRDLIAVLSGARTVPPMITTETAPSTGGSA